MSMHVPARTQQLFLLRMAEKSFGCIRAVSYRPLNTDVFDDPASTRQQVAVLKQTTFSD